MLICEANNISVLPQVIFRTGCFGTVHKVVPEGCVCVCVCVWFQCLSESAVFCRYRNAVVKQAEPMEAV